MAEASPRDGWEVDVYGCPADEDATAVESSRTGRWQWCGYTHAGPCPQCCPAPPSSAPVAPRTEETE